MTVLLEIIERVASERGADPVELPPLYEAIDADALQRCVESTRSPASVRFRYCGFAVTVRTNEDVTIESAEEAEPT